MRFKIVVAMTLLVLLSSAIAAADQLPRAFDFWLPSGGVLSHTGWLVGSMGDPATILLRKECSTELATFASNPSATTDDRISALAMLGLIAAMRDDFDTAEVYADKMAEFVGTKGARGAANSETIVAAFLLGASIKKELGKMDEAASYLRTSELILQGWESLEQPGENLLRACIAYVGADVFMSSDSQRDRKSVV